MTTTTRLRIIDEIIAPLNIQYFVNPRSVKGRYVMRCFLPGHDDHSPSFSVHENQEVWKCWVCGGGNGYQLQQRLSGQILPTPRAPTVRAPRNLEPVHLDGCTLEQLAEAKHLDANWLHQELGWTSDSWYGTPAVRIPYYLPDGTLHRNRFRVGLTGKERFRWGPGEGLQLYGLQYLPWIQQSGYCLFGEGETDAASCWHNQISYIGVPGVDTYKPEWNSLFNNLELYVWQEPGKAGETLVYGPHDPQGHKLRAGLVDHFPHIKIINAPPEAKDPNELLALLGPERFQARMTELMAHACGIERPELPAEIIPEEPSYMAECLVELAQIEGCFNTSNNWENDSNTTQEPTGFTRASWPEVNQKYRDDIRQSAIDHWRAVGNAKKAQNLERCYINYRAWKCQSTGEYDVKRFRCGEPACAWCSVWLTEAFFYRETRLENGETTNKAKLLERELKHPVIYEITFAEQDKPSQDDSDSIKAMEHEIVNWDNHLSQTHGKTHSIAADHIRGLRIRIADQKVKFQMLLLGDYVRGDREFLSNFFTAQSGLPVIINELRAHDVREAIELLSKLMAIRIDAMGEDYELARAGLKGARQLQGKGVFSKISGGMPKKQAGGHIRECRICGRCSPMETPEWYSVATTRVRTLVSEWTGLRYQTFVETGGFA